MDFSYNYRATMNAFATYIGAIPGTGISECSGSGNGILEMHFKLSSTGGEVPNMAYSNAVYLWNSIRQQQQLGPDQYITVVVPLMVDIRNVKRCSGADAIMKSFINRYSRLNKTVTPKGEIYYGGRGIILNKDLKPLIYATREFTSLGEFGEVDIPHSLITVHISPLIFTDDVPTLNKAILKRGIAYYLSHPVVNWGEGQTSAKVVIDDGSQFFKLPSRPGTPSEVKDLSPLLKGNIEEILKQVQDDIIYH